METKKQQKEKTKKYENEIQRNGNPKEDPHKIKGKWKIRGNKKYKEVKGNERRPTANQNETENDVNQKKCERNS